MGFFSSIRDKIADFRENVGDRFTSIRENVSDRFSSVRERATSFFSFGRDSPLEEEGEGEGTFVDIEETPSPSFRSDIIHDSNESMYYDDYNLSDLASELEMSLLELNNLIESGITADQIQNMMERGLTPDNMGMLEITTDGEGKLRYEFPNLEDAAMWVDNIGAYGYFNIAVKDDYVQLWEYV